MKPQSISHDNGTSTIEFPSICPRCHHAVSPLYKAGVLVAPDILSLSFQCTNCKELFVSKYFLRKLVTSEPLEFEKVVFETEIEDTSPTFVEIYNQSLIAESKSLNQLTGIGLRKALEFLIKDFLVYKKPEDEVNIKKTQLSRCINNYIDDSRLKKIAERATWLGNDETHYVRKWEDKDITDLKLLIKVAVNMIHNDLLTEKYLSEMKN